MKVYPHSSPIILDDDTFIELGGETGTSTSRQRQAAYLSAEKKASTFIGSFLLPTTVTGTYPQDYTRPVITDYGYVNEVKSVFLRSRDFDSDCSITETEKCAYIRDDGYGVLDINCAISCCQCTPFNIYQVQVAYEAGLPTGTITQDDYLSALVSLADQELKIISGDGGTEGNYGIGIKSFSNQSYSEQRVALNKTDLGSSPRANWIAGVLRPLRRRRIAGL